MIPVGADDVEHYSNLCEMEKSRVYLFFLRFNIHSNKPGDFFFCTALVLEMHFNLSCVV